MARSRSLLARADGFTLIELLVVILIIGILLAVAAPTFFGQEWKAQDSKAKQNLAVAYRAALADRKTNQDAFPPLGDASSGGTLLYDLTRSEPEYTFIAADGTEPNDYQKNLISVRRVSADEVDFMTRSDSGATFCLPTRPDQAPSFIKNAAGGNCTATTEAVASGSGSGGAGSSGSSGGSGEGMAGCYGGALGADSPMGYWRLDETSGVTAADSSTNSRTLAIIGAPTLGAAPLVCDGTAFDFSGNGGDVLTSAPGLVQPTTAATIELWFKPREYPASTQTLFTAETGYDAAAQPPGKLGFGFLQWTGAGDPQACFFPQGSPGGPVCVRSSNSPGGTLQLNQRYHVVATWNGTTADLYVNGTLRDALTDASRAGQQLQAPAGTRWAIGAEINVDGTYRDSEFNGIVDEAAVYDHALTSQQVQAHYNAGIS